MQHIAPCLWFDHPAQEAAEFYVSVFPNSRIVHVAHHTEAMTQVTGQPVGSVVTVAFELNGQPVLAFNAGSASEFTQALSLMVHCDTQDELDTLWDRLSDGGQPLECGWVRDKYGVSWQIIPTVVETMLRSRDDAAIERTMLALWHMQKLDVRKLEEAFSGG